MSKKNKRKQEEKIDKDLAEGFNISPDTRGAIMTIIIFLLAFLSILSFFNLAGTFGRALNYGLGFLFGWADWLFILVLLLFGYFLLRSQRHRLKFPTYLGLFLLISSFTGLFNFLVSDYSFADISQNGTGGGALGYGIGYVFSGFLGFWGSLAVLLAMLIIGIFISLNTSFKDISARARSFGLLKEKIIPSTPDMDNEEDTEEEFVAEESVLPERKAEETNIEIEKEEDGDTDNEPNEPTHRSRKKVVIPMDLLNRSTTKPDSGDIDANTQKIQKTFENFGIDVTMGDVSVGPTVTQYEIGWQ